MIASRHFHVPAVLALSLCLLQLGCRRGPATPPDAPPAKTDWCSEHGMPESQCTICHPELLAKNAEQPPAGQPRVRLATVETAAKAGIQTEEVREAAVDLALTVPARLAFDPTRSARLSSPATGVVRELRVRSGTRVKAGDTLVVVASAELSQAAARLRDAEAELVLASANVARQEQLVSRQIAAGKDLLQAEREREAARAAVAGARGVLASLGAGVAEALDSQGQLMLRAPRAGVVTRVDAAPGQAVTSEHVLVEIQDPARIWAELALPEREAARVREGAEVKLSLDSLPQQVLSARLTWLAPEVEARTRTVAARAELDNPEGALRAGMYGQARVQVAAHRGMVVPREAVQEGPQGPVAFVAVDERVYEPRSLRLGLTLDDGYEVLEGLSPGEKVVTRGSFLLKTEIMRGSLGAGCCDAVEK